MGVRDRPPLNRWSMFAVTWHLSVWLGLALVAACAVRLVLSHERVEAMGPTLLILLAMVVLGELRPVVASLTHE